jgi:hypothetical protein
MAWHSAFRVSLCTQLIETASRLKIGIGLRFQQSDHDNYNIDECAGGRDSVVPWNFSLLLIRRMYVAPSHRWNVF